MSPRPEHKREVIPILSLTDIGSGIDWLSEIFGFRVEGSRVAMGTTMVLGDQRILVSEGLSVAGAIGMHHLALSVPNVDDAMRICLARGGQLAVSMTPDGPLEIAEFWENGVRYVFFEGPEGVLIELCAKIDATSEATWGHSHFGVMCEDVDQERRLFESLGYQKIADHQLERSEGTINVTFLESGRYVMELFSGLQLDLRNSRVGWIGSVMRNQERRLPFA